MSTHIIDTSLSTNRFDKDLRYAELKEYMRLLSLSGVELFEVSSAVLSFFPEDADLSHITLRISNTDDIVLSRKYDLRFLTVTQEFFDYLPYLPSLPLFAEIAATEKTDLDKVDTYLNKLPADRIHAITFRGCFSTDVNGFRSFLMKASTKYGKPINIYPTNEKTNAVSVALNAEKFYVEFVTACYGSTERNCAELYDLCCNRNIVNLRFPTPQFNSNFFAARSLYRLIFSREPKSIQYMHTPGCYLPSPIYDTNSPFNADIERMNVDMYYGSAGEHGTRTDRTIENYEAAPDKMIKSILNSPRRTKKKKN